MLGLKLHVSKRGPRWILSSMLTSLIKYVTLVAIIGATKLVPFHLVKWLWLVWRSGIQWLDKDADYFNSDSQSDNQQLIIHPPIHHPSICPSILPSSLPSSLHPGSQYPFWPPHQKPSAPQLITYHNTSVLPLAATFNSHQSPLPASYKANPTVRYQSLKKTHHWSRSQLS